VNYTYDATGRQLTVVGAETYVADTSYYGFGPQYQQILGSGTKQVRKTTVIDEATGRLTSGSTDTQNQTTPTNWDEKLKQTYTFDNAGNVTGISETSGASVVANECFKYDGLRELTEAWTTTAAACQSIPSQAIVNGADPYWTSYTYNMTTGNRTTETKHATAGNTTRTYTYPASGSTSVRPHTVTSVAITGAATGTDTYTYGNSGNTATRNIAGSPGQTLTWDNEGLLKTITDTSGTTEYTYDPDGNQLFAVDPQGATVYLPGFELRKQGSTVTCTRYYGGVASRTPTGLTWLSADHHGTAHLAIDATTLTVTRRRLDPFGNPRAAVTAWPNVRGFVNGTTDGTGLTHLGARDYEPTTGRFISDDPITDPTDPLQLNGYAYAGSNPTTNSDATGLRTCNGGEDCAGDPTHGNMAYSPERARRDEDERQRKRNEVVVKSLTGLGKKASYWAKKLVSAAMSACKAMGMSNKCDDVNGASEDWCGYYGSVACAEVFGVSVRAKLEADKLLEELKATYLAQNMSPDDAEALAKHQANAFRHAYWMATLTGEYGYSREKALAFGMAHELDNSHPGESYPGFESSVDMNNNFTGAAVGEWIRSEKAAHRIASDVPVGRVIYEEIRRRATECRYCLDQRGTQP
jgi:RHS repeat-associated protein